MIYLERRRLLRSHLYSRDKESQDYNSFSPPGSQDSEASEEQKKEKILELKKKEKLLQEKLLQKVEELKKICLREAVRLVLGFPWMCWLEFNCCDVPNAMRFLLL